MRNKKERLISSFSLVDDKYIEEAEPKKKSRARRGSGAGTVIKKVASIAVIIALGLFLFVPYQKPISNVSAYAQSPYLPVISAIDSYEVSIGQSRYESNFHFITDNFWELLTLPFLFFGVLLGGATDMAPSDPEGDMMGGSNGQYVESTDNQVEGVLEADVVKMTDKYIFRLTSETGELILHVFSIQGMESELITSFEIAYVGRNDYNEMYLSQDGNTVTVVCDFGGTVGVYSLDVSDLQNISIISTVHIDGSYNTSRFVDGRLLMISDYYYGAYEKVDYERPETFIPSVERNGVSFTLPLEDIIIPEVMNSRRYSVVTLLNEGNLEISGAKALLNFTNSVYISKNSIYLAHEYSATEAADPIKNVTNVITDIAILGYGEEGLAERGNITVRGSLKDQYSFDEHEGHLRVVTSTTTTTVYGVRLPSGALTGTTSSETYESASLYVFDLSDGSLVASVESFAPEGEEAVSVRFEDDSLYVCTARIITFTDPVYFFDLSDYGNITYTDTGIIDGFSSSLVDMGEGFLLGIGRENWQHNKVEVYEERDGQVVSVAIYRFEGEYADNYKSYYINREENLFGFAYEGYERDKHGRYMEICRYVLLHFDGYDLTEVAIVDCDYSYPLADMRGYVIDGHLYVLSYGRLTVRDLGDTAAPDHVVYIYK